MASVRPLEAFEQYPERITLSCAVARGECQWGPEDCTTVAQAAKIGLTHNEHTGHGVHIDRTTSWFIRGQGN